MTDAPSETGILMLGGWNEPTSDDNEWQGVSAFNPDTGWTELADAEPDPGDVFAFDRQSARAVFLEVGGGTWAFDPATATWGQLQTDAPPAHGSRMVYDSGSDRLVAFGGDEFGPLVDTTSVYDLETNTWTEMDPATSPSPRSYFAMAYDDESDRVILFGGSDAVGPLGDTWAYDVDTDSWTRLARGGGPEPRVYTAMAYDRETDRVILFGGVRGTEESPLDDTWAFDLETKTWTQLDAEGPSARGWHVMAADAETGAIVLFGGGPSREACTDETWIFDPEAETWTRS
jgi:N-acetylneuraminic acid mutarotase